MTIKTQAFLQGYLHEKTAAAMPARRRQRQSETLEIPAPTKAELQEVRNAAPRPGMASRRGTSVPDFDQYNWEDFVKKNPSPGRQYGFLDIKSRPGDAIMKMQMKNFSDYQKYLPKGSTAHRLKRWANPVETYDQLVKGIGDTAKGVGWDAVRGLVSPRVGGTMYNKLKAKPSFVGDIKGVAKDIKEDPSLLQKMVTEPFLGPGGLGNILTTALPATWASRLTKGSKVPSPDYLHQRPTFRQADLDYGHGGPGGTPAGAAETFARTGNIEKGRRAPMPEAARVPGSAARQKFLDEMVEFPVQGITNEIIDKGGTTHWANYYNEGMPRGVFYEDVKGNRLFHRHPDDIWALPLQHNKPAPVGPQSALVQGSLAYNGHANIYGDIGMPGDVFKYKLVNPPPGVVFKQRPKFEGEPIPSTGPPLRAETIAGETSWGRPVESPITPTDPPIRITDQDLGKP
jgi:hypothetical protein